MNLTTTRAPLSVPGVWLGPETPGHWWRVRCGGWARWDDRHAGDRCARRARRERDGEVLRRGEAIPLRNRREAAGAASTCCPLPLRPATTPRPIRKLPSASRSRSWR